nr:hypothetical protein [Tanacetum cinerariifolium]
IKFGDSYKVPTNTDPDDTTTKRDAEQSGRTVTFSIEDMQKKKNDVKARTTLLLSLPDEHQLSKPYEESSTQVPKGSGKPNPTASSSNPPANQMETLTVESPLPTISSPVPTACLNDSPKPSSEARLISKRVANQEESPSLDNILPLTNRFEDILGVSTSLDETIGVEADVSDALQDPS